MLTKSTDTFNEHGRGFSNKFTAFLADHLPFTSRNGTAGVQTKPTMLSSKPADVVITDVPGPVPVTILQVDGPLNAANYKTVMATTRTRYQEGMRNLVLDLSKVTAIGLSGLVALHSIAVLLDGEEPIDPEDGWEALRAVARDLEARSLQKQFKLFNPQPGVQRALEQAGFTGFLEIQTDLETVIASF